MSSKQYASDADLEWLSYKNRPHPDRWLLQLPTTRRFIQVRAIYFDLAALDTFFIQSGLIVDADEDGDTILGYLDSGLGGDLWR